MLSIPGTPIGTTALWPIFRPNPQPSLHPDPVDIVDKLHEVTFVAKVSHVSTAISGRLNQQAP